MAVAGLYQPTKAAALHPAVQCSLVTSLRLLTLAQVPLVLLVSVVEMAASAVAYKSLRSILVRSVMSVLARWDTEALKTRETEVNIKVLVVSFTPLRRAKAR
jgi:hypothetical protein